MSQVSLRVSLVLCVTAFPSELAVLKEFLVKQGSNLDAASCLCCDNLCCSFSFDPVSSKETDRLSVSVTAVLPPTEPFCTARLALFLWRAQSFLFIICREQVKNSKR